LKFAIPATSRPS